MNIRALIKQLIQEEERVILGKVNSVDLDQRTCVVEPIDGSSTIYDVRLQAAVSGSLGLLMVPKVGSVVVVQMLNENTGFIAINSACTTMEFGVDQVKFTLTDQGLSLRKSSDDLRETMVGLLDQVTGLVDNILISNYNHPQGATIGLLPTSVQALNQRKVGLQEIKTKLENLLA